MHYLGSISLPEIDSRFFEMQPDWNEPTGAQSEKPSPLYSFDVQVRPGEQQLTLYTLYIPYKNVKSIPQHNWSFSRFPVFKTRPFDYLHQLGHPQSPVYILRLVAWMGVTVHGHTNIVAWAPIRRRSVQHRRLHFLAVEASSWAPQCHGWRTRHAGGAKMDVFL